jgi:hypothetical protein
MGLLRALNLSLAATGVLVLVAGASAARAAEAEDIRGPDVTIIEEKDRTVLEYRQGGVLRMVRIVPTWGKPYYLVPRDQTAGHEDLERADALLPTWVIVEF